MILISACLVGINCKYDGGNNYREIALNLVKRGVAIPICPEQLGGLTTPRSPSCGVGKIYNGNFDGKLIDGNGILAQLLIDNNIEVIDIEDYIDSK